MAFSLRADFVAFGLRAAAEPPQGGAPNLIRLERTRDPQGRLREGRDTP